MAKISVSGEGPGSRHDLWIGDRNVLTISIDKNSCEFPPTFDNCGDLNTIIQGLARAANSVMYQAENDETVKISFAMQPIGDIANAIILLSQLSQAVLEEMRRTETEKAT
jgi:hypothetical protein